MMKINEAIKIVEDMLEAMNYFDVVVYDNEKEAMDILIKIAKQYQRDNENGYRGM